MAIPGQEKGITLGDIPIREGGKRIIADELKFGKPEYGSKRIENLVKDLGGSASDLYYCIQFAKKYKEIPTALENLAWREIALKYLAVFSLLKSILNFLTPLEN